MEQVAEQAGGSRRMVPALWGSGGSEEEGREYLRARMTTLWKVMFWAFVALIGSQLVLYEVYEPSIKPYHQDRIYVAATIGLAIMAVIWRGVLARNTKLSIDQLYAIDTFYSIASGTILGFCAICAEDFPPSHYVCLIYGAYAVFARAIVVPSSGRRTLVVASLNFVPLIVAALYLTIYGNVQLPRSVFFLGGLSLSVVAVILAALGSDRIYGLRQKVTEVMQLGKYVLGEKIGEGGMGKVYEARHLLLRRPTAIKLMHANKPEYMQRFEAEVQAMSELTHPNTAAVYDYGQSDGVFYYAMEYLGDGIDLAKLIRMYGAQPSGRVAKILEQICGALAEAHERKLIHRDIKPNNIILCERGLIPDVAKVVDFGLVKDIAPEAAGQSTQVIVGTPHYLAPEQLLGRPIGPPVDLYALGLVGYELLTGKKPFEGKTVMEYATKHITQKPSPPSQVSAIHIPRELEAIIMKCLEKEPDHRFTSATEMADALRALPTGDDWTRENARAWWREYGTKRKAEIAMTQQATREITVDLKQRT
ncbi:MAG: serine/threonine protein kinase [Deltaproteobacteria bacterium]|nr:serine/threonine protein kinase [Deltaproteobacteria bacterium]